MEGYLEGWRGLGGGLREWWTYGVVVRAEVGKTSSLL